jgi:hypothetical protein
MREKVYVFNEKKFDDNHFEIKKRLGQIKDDLNYLDEENLTNEKVDLLKDRMKKDLNEAIEHLDRINNYE